MTNREKHCYFAVLNINGRCIANCSENLLRDFESDCIGRTGRTTDYEGTHEVQVTCGFLDGRNRQLDAKGYQIIRPEPVTVKPVALPDQESELISDGTWYYRWASTPAGHRYKKYIKRVNP